MEHQREPDPADADAPPGSAASLAWLRSFAEAHDRPGEHGKPAGAAEGPEGTAGAGGTAAGPEATASPEAAVPDPRTEPAGTPADPVPATGEPRVDAALRLLERLPGLPVSDHPELFEQVHAQLSEVLGELDSGSGGPATS